MSDPDDKAARLAAALRDNLRKRKAQARESLPATARESAEGSAVVPRPTKIDDGGAD